MDKLRIEKIGKEEMYNQCISCSKIVNKIVEAPMSKKGEKIVGDLYYVRLSETYNVLCKDCLTKLRDMINDELEDKSNE